MAEPTSLDIQAKIIPALTQLGATDKLVSAVRTSKLAKRIRRLGIRADVKAIAVELEKIAATQWGRQYSTFAGGSPDPLNQCEWALPQ